MATRIELPCEGSEKTQPRTLIGQIKLSGKKELSLHEALDLLQNLPYENKDAIIDDSLDEEVSANYLLKISSSSLASFFSLNKAINPSHDIVIYSDSLGQGHHKEIQICIATHSWRRLRSKLGVVVYKSIRRNKPALLQSFELSPPTKEHGTFYEHQAGGNALAAEKLCSTDIQQNPGAFEQV
ncbi:hypothetical protein TNCV_2540411 [Trichonephila clavipes]|nr:hypothetical protein TNCV_2540411 [Trichonephila clavipes]